jgi:hypothetical protein
MENTKKRISIDISYDTYEKLRALSFRRGVPTKRMAESILEYRTLSLFGRIREKLFGGG